MIFNFIISILLAIIGVLYIAYGFEQYRQEEMRQASQNRFDRKGFYHSNLSIIFGVFSLVIALLNYMKVLLLG